MRVRWVIMTEPKQVTMTTTTTMVILTVDGVFYSRAFGSVLGALTLTWDLPGLGLVSSFFYFFFVFWVYKGAFTSGWKWRIIKGASWQCGCRYIEGDFVAIEYIAFAVSSVACYK